MIQTVGNWTALEWLIVIGIVVGTVAGWYMAITAIYSSNGKKDSE